MRWIPRNIIKRNLRLEAGVLLPILLAQSLYAELMVTPQDLADRFGGAPQVRIQSPDVSVYYIVGKEHFIEAGFVDGELQSIVFDLYSVDRKDEFEEFFSELTIEMERCADYDAFLALDSGVASDDSVVCYERTDKSGFAIMGRSATPGRGFSLSFQTRIMQLALVRYYRDLIPRGSIEMTADDNYTLLMSAYRLRSEEALNLLLQSIYENDVKRSMNKKTGQLFIDETYSLCMAFFAWIAECAKSNIGLDGHLVVMPLFPIIQNKVRVIHSDVTESECSDTGLNSSVIAEIEILDFRPNLEKSLGRYCLLDVEMGNLFGSFLHLDKPLERGQVAIGPDAVDSRVSPRLEFLRSSTSIPLGHWGEVYLVSFPLVDHIVFDKYFRSACVDFKIGIHWYRVHFAKAWWGGWEPKEYRHLWVE